MPRGGAARVGGVPARVPLCAGEDAKKRRGLAVSEESGNFARRLLSSRLARGAVCGLIVAPEWPRRIRLGKPAGDKHLSSYTNKTNTKWTL